MAFNMATTGENETMVGMGQAFARRAPQRLWSILGSCVAVALCDPKRHAGALSHVVLPAASGRNGSPAKFADTAIPHMLQLLRETGIPADGLTAKIAGGASMFGRSLPLEVGASNILSIVGALQAAGIRIAAQDVGGTQGRRVTLDCSSGELLVEILGSAAKIL
jgi:chemotaxis protein CheD